MIAKIRSLLFATFKNIKRYECLLISISVHLILAIIFSFILIISPQATKPGLKVAVIAKPEKGSSGISSQKVKIQLKSIKPKKDIKPLVNIKKITLPVKEKVIMIKKPLKALPSLGLMPLKSESLGPSPARIVTRYKGYSQAMQEISTHGRGFGNSSGSGRGGVSFFGMGGGKGGGNIKSVVYVVDRSGSMYGEKINLVKKELRRSISNLSPSQHFTVIFYSSKYYEVEFGIGRLYGDILYGSWYKTLEDGTRTVVVPKQIGIGSLKNASSENKKESYRFINSIGAGGGTWPYEAIKRALSYEPNLIYFLTDGLFFPVITQRLNTETKHISIYEDIASLNNGRHTIINTIAFQTPRESETMLKTIAKQNNGAYRYVQ